MLTHSRNPGGSSGARASGARRGSSSAVLEVESAHLSDRGCVREGNEDYVGAEIPHTPERARTHGWLFALGDGVGGHEQGEVASRMAVETLLAGFREAPDGEPHALLLPRLIQAANLQVYEAGRAGAPGGIPMGTTLVACALRFDRTVVAHVGDSRCYLIRRGHAKLLTRDHTVAGEQVRLGVLSRKEAASAESRHLLSRCLGSDLFVAVDISENLLLPDDVLLLCSDGLHGAVPDAELPRILNRHDDLEAAARELVTIANQRDGSDNVSVQLIRVRGVERVGMYRGRPYKLR